LLDLVAKLRKQGKSEVGEYYAAYAAAQQWAYAAGVVDGRAAMLVYDRNISLEAPAYFVALDFDGDRVVSIHDFLFARYAMDGVDLQARALCSAQGLEGRLAHREWRRRGAHSIIGTNINHHRCRHAYRVDWFPRRQRQNSVS
jgi:hypothetical protein